MSSSLSERRNLAPRGRPKWAQNEPKTGTRPYITGFSDRLLGKIAIDVFAVQEANKDNYIARKYQTDATISYLDTVVAITASEFLDVFDLSQMPRPFDALDHLFHTRLQVSVLNALQISDKAGFKLDVQGEPFRT
jgi:hypothetical protein